MYVNREPRFYVSITYSGSYWIHEGEGRKVIEMHYTGNNGMRGTWDYTKTGYLIRKNIHPNSNPRLNVNVRRPYALIRLGEIRSEEHTSELQSLMRISYAVFCLKKKKTTYNNIEK